MRSSRIACKLEIWARGLYLEKESPEGAFPPSRGLAKSGQSWKKKPGLRSRFQKPYTHIMTGERSSTTTTLGRSGLPRIAFLNKRVTIHA